MTKLKKTNCDKIKKLQFWENSNCEKRKNSNCDQTEKLKLWQTSKTRIVTKFKNSNCDKTQKLKLWEKKIKLGPNSNTQSVTVVIVTVVTVAVLTVVTLAVVTVVMVTWFRKKKNLTPHLTCSRGSFLWFLWCIFNVGGFLQQEREYSWADWIDPLLFTKKNPYVPHIFDSVHRLRFLPVVCLCM